MQPRNMSMSGVVDLAAVKQAQEAKAKAEQARAEAARQGGTGAVPASSLVIDVTEAGFERDVLQRSTEVPVVIDFWAEWCEPCKQLGPLLERLAHEYNGRFLLAKVDVDANQMLMQQFGIQGIPAVFAVVAGQALPLFQGAAPEAQIRETLDQLIQVGEERFGLTGLTVDPGSDAGDPAAVPEEPAGPYDALLEAAVQALDSRRPGRRRPRLPERPLRRPGQHRGQARPRPGRTPAPGQRPGPAEGPPGRRRAPGRRRRAVRRRRPGPGGRPRRRRLRPAGRHRAGHRGDDRNKARLHLLDLFEVVGAEDPRVTAARTALARVLF